MRLIYPHKRKWKSKKNALSNQFEKRYR